MEVKDTPSDVQIIKEPEPQISEETDVQMEISDANPTDTDFVAGEVKSTSTDESSSTPGNISQITDPYRAKRNALSQSIKDGVTDVSDSNIVCNLCNKSFFLSEDATEHFKEDVHQRNEEAAIATKHSESLGDASAIKLKQQLSCNLCEVSFNSVSQVYAHFIGRKHKAKEALQSKAPGFQSSTFSQPGVPNKKRAATTSATASAANRSVKRRGSQGMQATPMASGMVSPVSAPQDFYCNFCNVTVNSKTQLERHCNGIKHKLKTGELQEAPEWWIEREKQRPAKDKPQKGKLLRCEVCNITVNSEDQLAVHLRGRTHYNHLHGIVPPQEAQGFPFGGDSHFRKGKNWGPNHPSESDGGFAVPNANFGHPVGGRDQGPFSGGSWSPAGRPPPGLASSTHRPPRPPLNRGSFAPQGPGNPAGPIGPVARQGESDFLSNADPQGRLPFPPVPPFPLISGRGRGASMGGY